MPFYPNRSQKYEEYEYDEEKAPEIGDLDYVSPYEARRRERSRIPDAEEDTYIEEEEEKEEDTAD